MNTTPLIPTIDIDPLERLDDEAIVAMFADGGLTVEIVETCGDASCPDCFAPAPARAA